MKSNKTAPSKSYKKPHIKQHALSLILVLVITLLTTYIGYRVNSSDKTLIPICVLPLLGGLIFEYKRISQKWSTVILTALASFVFSFIAFLPRKGEGHYVFDNHVQIWPFVFLGIFIMIAVVSHEKEITQQLTEGITLLQSLAIIYWGIDLAFWETESVTVKALVAIGLLFAFFSIFVAFTNIVLSRTVRLSLSIWSSIIMVLFAVDNVYTVYQNDELEAAAFLSTRLYIGLQYFLLGISSIYMAQNIVMLFGFLPGKGTFFNQQYSYEVKQLKAQHIKRYSSTQVRIFDAFLCVIVTGTIFGLNYHYKFLPANFIIWTTFAFFPYFLHLYYILRKR